MKPIEEYKQATATQHLELPDLNPEFPKTYVKICCPNCNGDIPADNLNINDKIAKCGSCDIVFPFHEEIKTLLPTTQKVKQEILRPEGIEMFYYKDELDISFKQPYSFIESLVYIFGAMFFLPVSGAFPQLGINGKLFFLMFLFLCIFYLIQRFRQRIFLNINDRSLNIHQRPTKMSRDKSYAIQDIHQLYVTKDNSGMKIWNVMMIIDKGQGQKHIKLASVKSISKAKFLEQEIERHLGIQDVVVPEES